MTTKLATACEPAELADRLGTDLDAGLSAGEAAERLERDGPNALPAEKPPSALRGFLSSTGSK